MEEFKFLMAKLDLTAKHRGMLCKNMTALDCRNAFDNVVETLGVPTVTPKGRRRHLERMKWPTYLMNMPDKSRPKRVRHVRHQSPGGTNLATNVSVSVVVVGIDA